MSPGILEPGAIILVSGADGFLASHVSEALMRAGYRVRGTSRSEQHIAFLKEKWRGQFLGLFESRIVEDLVKEGAADEALQGVSAVAHLATVTGFSADPEQVISPVVSMVTNLLQSASKVPTIKRFVYTSSTAAGISHSVNGTPSSVHLDETSWNTEASRLARELPSNDPTKGYQVYCASKSEAERAAWRFMEAEKPHFELNTVLPAMVIGELLDPPAHFTATAGWSKALFAGDKSSAETIAPQQFVNATDTALVHLGALTLPSVVSQRLWTTSSAFNWDQILSIFRTRFPEKYFPANFQSARDESTVDTCKATAILKELGAEGWKDLETSLWEAVGV